MTAGTPTETLAAALYAALFRDLPDIEYMDRDWEVYRATVDAMTRDERRAMYAREREQGVIEGPMVEKCRRPRLEDCSVDLFDQMWPSTALGYGGMGGAAMTSACTVVVECHVTHTRAVYFGPGGRLAYLLKVGDHEEEFATAKAKRVMPCAAAAARLGWIEDRSVDATKETA